jgi:hypothetical protein
VQPADLGTFVPKTKIVANILSFYNSRHDQSTIGIDPKNNISNNNKNTLCNYIISTISHVLFVNDVLILGARKIEYWMTLKSILSKFYDATRMAINCHKSVFLLQNTDKIFKHNATSVFDIKIENLDQGMKYLGFFLKPNKYRVNDWLWLLKKIEKRIGNWAFRWLSLGGRLTLANSVLHSIHVYWLNLVKLPSSVIH